MSKKKALIITSAHKPFNKLKKKIGKNHILFYESQLDYGQIKLPSIDVIYIVGPKEVEHKWRRILYRRQIAIKINYVGTYI